jgi:site-specific recombinase XerD
MGALRQRFTRELEVRGMSNETIDNYVPVIASLSTFCGKPPLQLKRDDIVGFLHHRLKVEHVAPSTLNNNIAAIKSFFSLIVRDTSVLSGIENLKHAKHLPMVLTTDEVASMIEATDNLKHRCILEVLYCSGIRLQECIDLEPGDILSKQMLIHVRHGKGDKSRYTLLSRRALESLRVYAKATRLRKYLFEGRNGALYSRRSVEKVVSSAGVRAGIGKAASPHMLRHSFATHLLDHGVDIRIIQKLLGHASIKTTTIYTHVSTQSLERVVSPLDHLELSQGGEL